MNKINEMKLAFMQMKKNFKEEASNAVSSKTSGEDEIPVFTLAQKKTNLSNMEKRLAEIKARIPQVQKLEVDLAQRTAVR